ncbi:hypothetical protein Droror1_Dr00005212 [Drosera rotundifolia]
MKKQPSINIQPLCLLLAHGETRRIQRSTAISIIQFKIYSKSCEEEDNSQRDNKKKNLLSRKSEAEVGSTAGKSKPIDHRRHTNQSPRTTTAVSLRNHLPECISSHHDNRIQNQPPLPRKFTTSSPRPRAPHASSSQSTQTQPSSHHLHTQNQHVTPPLHHPKRRHRL